MASGAARAATAAADPPEDPPGTRSGSQGFFAGKYAEFSFEQPIPNSSQFVLPIGTAPAPVSRATQVAWSGATKPARIFEPAVDGSEATLMLSFTASGTPASGSFSPARLRRSTSSAARRAPSSSRWRNVPRRSALFFARESDTSATSRAETDPDGTDRANSVAG